MKQTVENMRGKFTAQEILKTCYKNFFAKINWEILMIPHRLVYPFLLIKQIKVDDKNIQKQFM